MTADLLQDYFAASARRSPASTALAGIDAPVSYADLWTLGGRIAAGLIERGLRPGSRVCLLMPKSPAAIASILGVLRAGGAYVPLDPNSPLPRLARMVHSCDDRWLLTVAGQAHLARDLIASHSPEGGWVVGWMDEGSRPEQETGPEHFGLKDLPSPATPPNVRVDPDDPAYLMFTSGSTGVPKGVVITHANVRAFIDWAVPYFGLNYTDRVSGHPPLHFDLSVFDIFGAAAAGAALYLVPPKLNIMAHALARFIEENQLTHWFSVPSVLNYLVNAEAVEIGSFPSLRRVLWCGEVLPTATLVQLMTRLPHATFTNLYGPTEATVASSFHTVTNVPQADMDIPIGTACGGERLFVLNDALERLPAGEPGHLFIAGVGLSPGYWRADEDANAAFITPDQEKSLPQRIYRTGDVAWADAEGILWFVGRADRQIKSRGYRIELGEIESALQTIEYLDEVSVVALPVKSFEGMRICCAHAPEHVDDTQLMADLRAHLPPYMIPTSYRGYAVLPKNPSGKTDRRAISLKFRDSIEGSE